MVGTKWNKDRLTSGHDDAGDNRLVDIPGDQDRFSRIERGNDHRLVPARRAVQEKVGAIGPVNLCGQFLGFLDDTPGFLEGVDLVEAGQINGKNPGPDKFAKTGGDPLAALVSRSMEGNLSAFGERDHRVEKRCFALVHGGSDRLVVGKDGVIVLDDEIGAVEPGTDMAGEAKDSLMGESVVEPKA